MDLYILFMISVTMSPILIKSHGIRYEPITVDANKMIGLRPGRHRVPPYLLTTDNKIVIFLSFKISHALYEWYDREGQMVQKSVYESSNMTISSFSYKTIKIISILRNKGMKKLYDFKPKDNFFTVITLHNQIQIEAHLRVTRWTHSCRLEIQRANSQDVSEYIKSCNRITFENLLPSSEYQIRISYESNFIFNSSVTTYAPLFEKQCPTLEHVVNNVFKCDVGELNMTSTLLYLKGPAFEFGTDVNQKGSTLIFLLWHPAYIYKLYVLNPEARSVHSFDIKIDAFNFSCFRGVLIAKMSEKWDLKFTICSVFFSANSDSEEMEYPHQSFFTQENCAYFAIYLLKNHTSRSFGIVMSPYQMMYYGSSPLECDYDYDFDLYNHTQSSLAGREEPIREIQDWHSSGVRKIAYMRRLQNISGIENKTHMEYVLSEYLSQHDGLQIITEDAKDESIHPDQPCDDLDCASIENNETNHRVVNFKNALEDGETSWGINT